MKTAFFSVPLFVLAAIVVDGQEWKPERCELLPLPGKQVAFLQDGNERLRWHFGGEYPRPFFFPLKGPSGVSLTRMGHPGAENHDHHRSVWFAHHEVNGVSYWADSSKATIRQKHWYSYRDGDDEAVMASLLGWYDEEGTEVMEQDVFAVLLPGEKGEYSLEIQLNCRPAPGAETVELGRTNFGFFAVRVAKSLSHHFGGGVLTDSEGRVGEKEIFGKAARWMDYSGPVAVGTGPDRAVVIEGITYFDHPENPRYPTKWHVRSDGWMGASFCMDGGLTLTKEAPLTLRYLLHVHSGACDAKVSEAVAEKFAKRKPFVVTKSSQPHRQYEVRRDQATSGEDLPEGSVKKETVNP